MQHVTDYVLRTIRPIYSSCDIQNVEHRELFWGMIENHIEKYDGMVSWSQDLVCELWKVFSITNATNGEYKETKIRQYEKEIAEAKKRREGLTVGILQEVIFAKQN